MLRTGEHVEIFLAGPRHWNHWRDTNSTQIPDLRHLRPTLNQRQMGSVNGGPVNLRGAILQDAFLRYATLSHADLTDADLADADVACARLDNANLKNANLTNAVLDHTDFSNAVLNGVIIRGASLKQALNLTQEQINRCVGDATTVLPEYVERPASWSKKTNSSKSVQETSETAPAETEYSQVGELTIGRRAKAIGVALVLIPLSALLWNFLADHETIPSPSPTKVTTIDVIPESIPSVAPDVSRATVPKETAALPPRPVVEWMSETVHGGHALSDSSSMHSDERHAIAALGIQPEVSVFHTTPPLTSMPLEPETVQPITTTPDVLPNGPTIPEPEVSAPELRQKQTNMPDAPTPSPKTKKTKVAAKPAPLAKNTKGFGGAISDLLAGGL